jgi:site-specific recombinase XerD
MSSLAPTLEAFFTERLYRQLEASPHTVRAYRDTFRLLLDFAHRRTGKTPSQLDLADLDTPLITAFLDHLEHDRHNTVRTRNARLAAIRSMFRYASYREPAHAALIQRVLAIPDKRHRRTIVSFLSTAEIDALVAAPDRHTWIGRRDHALLVTAIQTGLRVSELTNLHRQDVHLDTGAHIRCYGKGRKQRCTPLSRHTVAVLRTWTAELTDRDHQPLFPTRRGSPLKPDSVGDLVDRHVAVARQHCPDWTANNVTPHTLRHTAAMQLLQAGVETSVIALWLGHEEVQTTQIYLHGDLTMKERALARTSPPNTPPGRDRAPDTLLAFLEAL